MQKISQSFIKSFRDYKNGDECGLLIKHQYADGKLLDRYSHDMALGSYFEYVLTGALPKNGKIPLAEYTVTGQKKSPADRKISDMTTHYQRAHWNAGVVRNYLQIDLGLEFVHIGKRLTKGRFEGTLDLICRVTKSITFEDGTEWKVGDMIVIDIKYSGLLHNRWEKHGWMWSDIQKEYHGTQAMQYNFVSELPFYFLVVGNSNNEIPNYRGGGFEPTEIKFMFVPITEEMTARHIRQANALAKELEVDKEIGFVARPDFIRCGKCPLFEGCDRKHTYPHPKSVDLTITRTW